MRCASAATSSGTQPRWLWAAAFAVSAALAGCSNDPREAELGAQCPNYEQNVEPLLAQSCEGCHGEAKAEAGYRVDSYLAAVRPREDGTARLTPGAEDSLFLQAARGELAGHPALAESSQKTLEDWAVRCGTARKDLVFHSNSWMNPWAEDFHGRTLRANGYDTAECAECHGEDLSGGKAQVACSQCHADNQPLNSCSTCHGSAANPAPPKDLEYLSATTRLGVGAHQTHVTDGKLHKAYGCEVCHVTPTTATDDGHFRKGNVPDTSVADVTLASGKGGTAAWDRNAATCSNGACHAPVADANATHQTPVWTKVGEGQANCRSCHGLPPSTHNPGTTECSMCHRPGFDGANLNPATHANGKVELAYQPGQPGQCVVCHGSGDQPAPPVDLQGRTDPTLMTIGAHRPHLEARHLLSAPVACSECHKVPTNVEDPGHMDSDRPAEVFPQLAGVGGIANARGSVSMFDPNTGTCTTYCHGSAGGTLPTDARASNQTPSWVGTTAENAACGTCHGIPPQTPSHVQQTDLSTCAMCHAGTITPQGAIIVTTDPATGQQTSKHIDGQVSLQTSP